jgi:hypothetical protein
MLSPKMQRTVRVNDSQLVMLSERAHYDHNMTGYLYKKTADSTKWQQRWFVLYQVGKVSSNTPTPRLGAPGGFQRRDTHVPRTFLFSKSVRINELCEKIINFC